MAEDTLQQRIGAAAAKHILFLPHAVQQMSRPERVITPRDVLQVVSYGEVVEDYPEDVRGHSCLMLGYDETNRPIHVVCSPKAEYLAVITAYIPNPREWSADFRRRIR